MPRYSIIKSGTSLFPKRNNSIREGLLLSDVRNSEFCIAQFFARKNIHNLIYLKKREKKKKADVWMIDGSVCCSFKRHNFTRVTFYLFSTTRFLRRDIDARLHTEIRSFLANLSTYSRANTSMRHEKYTIILAFGKYFRLFLQNSWRYLPNRGCLLNETNSCHDDFPCPT